MRKLLSLTLAVLMLFSCCIRFPYKGQQYIFEAKPEWSEEN